MPSTFVFEPQKVRISVLDVVLSPSHSHNATFSSVTLWSYIFHIVLCLTFVSSISVYFSSSYHTNTTNAIQNKTQQFQLGERAGEPAALSTAGRPGAGEHWHVRVVVQLKWSLIFVPLYPKTHKHKNTTLGANGQRKSKGPSSLIYFLIIKSKFVLDSPFPLNVVSVCLEIVSVWIDFIRLFWFSRNAPSPVPI